MNNFITIEQRGSFKNTERYLRRLTQTNLLEVLGKYGNLGVVALSNATPARSGQTAESWYYTIEQRPGYYSIRWHNRHIVDGIPIAVILQYGHATRSGGWVEGRDYIMPAIRPIFDQIVAEAMKEVTKT